MLGSRYIVNPFFGINFATGEVTRTTAPWRAFARDLNRAGRMARDAGLKRGYHNHNWEFFRLTDNPTRTAYDVLTDSTDPTEHAGKMGVGGRHTVLAGDAFTANWGGGYDIALMTNFLHHFDIPTCTTLLKKVAAALKPGGRVAVLEFVPNDDRVSPPFAAAFAMQMLAGTPSGDAYTLAELTTMLKAAGFATVSGHPLQGPETLVVATK